MPSFEGACASDWHALVKDYIHASCSQSRFANVSAHRVPIELKALTVSRTLSLSPCAHWPGWAGWASDLNGALSDSATSTAAFPMPLRGVEH